MLSICRDDDTKVGRWSKEKNWGIAEKAGGEKKGGGEAGISVVQGRCVLGKRN